MAKTVWRWHKARWQTRGLNPSLEITSGQLTLTAAPKSFPREKTVFPTNAEPTEYPHAKNKQTKILRPYTSYTKINSKRTIDPDVRAQTTKLQEENTGKDPHDPRLGRALRHNSKSMRQKKRQYINWIPLNLKLLNFQGTIMKSKKAKD